MVCRRNIVKLKFHSNEKSVECICSFWLRHKNMYSSQDSHDLATKLQSDNVTK